MAHEPPPPRVVRAGSATGWWELAHRPPHPALRGVVERVCGYRERSTAPVTRRMPATSRIPVVLSFGPRLDVEMARSRDGYVSFVAGLHPGPAVTSYRGEQFGVQLDLTPLGAFRLFGVPGAHVAHRVVDLADVAPALGGDRTLDRLATAPDWAQRLDVLDGVLARLAADGPGPDPLVVWLWHQLEASAGTARIADLVEETGRSHRHVTARFRSQVGLTPKAAARVIRFEHAARAVAAGRASLAAVAAAHGYADQSHLTREFVALAGAPPAAFARDAGGAPTPVAAG